MNGIRPELREGRESEARTQREVRLLCAVARGKKTERSRTWLAGVYYRYGGRAPCSYVLVTGTVPKRPQQVRLPCALSTSPPTAQPFTVRISSHTRRVSETTSLIRLKYTANDLGVDVPRRVVGVDGLSCIVIESKAHSWCRLADETALLQGGFSEIVATHLL